MSDVTMSNRIARRRNVRKSFLAVLALFVMIFVFTFLVQVNRNNEMEVEAASLDGFDPGYIISDWQMGNYNSMSEADIQAFLTSKNSCANRDYDYYLRLSRNSGYQWHWDNGHFVCLSEELFGDGEVIGSGETAAHILWQTAQDYKINPQALLVLLQKETGLITDPIPNNGDYRKATGYGCPDTAPCSSEYYGFKNQVRRAAALFRTVLDGGWTNYPLGENYVQYNPNPDCGGSVVNIRSLATSALYRYTPYQPNDGALAAGYGTAYCGAYGNRNFYLYFQDWFGGIKDTKKSIKIEDINQAHLSDDTYYITSSANNKVLLANGLNDSDNIEVGVPSDDGAQRWVITKNDDYYIIKNEKSGKVFDIANGRYNDLTNLWQFSYNDSCAQRWIFNESNDGSYIIHNYCDPTYVLDLQEGKTNVQIYSKTDYDNMNQKWVIKKAVRRDDYSGIYNILSMGDKSKAMSVYNDSSADGANIQVSKNNNSNMQRWEISKKENYYLIKNIDTGKFLDVANAKYSNLTNVWQFSYNGTCAQRWLFIENSDGTVTIQNACEKNYVLDLQDGKTNVQIYSKITNYISKNQRWILEASPLPNDTYYITSSANNKVLLANGLNDSDNIEVGVPSDDGAQRWVITKNDDYYIIKNEKSGKVFDIANGRYNDLTNLWQFSYNDSCAQRWIFNESNDGSYIIHNYCDPTYVLDLQEGKTNVQIYSKTDYDNMNQKWVIKKAVRRDDYSGIYNILSMGDKSKAMSVYNDSSADGANIQVSKNNNSNMQRWEISKKENYYLIKNIDTGKFLDVANAKYSNLTNVWQFSYNGTCAQRWLFIENSDGTVTIQNACEKNYVLDLQDGKTNVQIYSKITNYISKNQRWILEEQ